MGEPFVARLQRWTGPLPGAREARAISIMALVAGVAMCGASLFYGFKGQTFMGRHLGSDFAEFYAAGKIQNQMDPARIYDGQLITRVQHESVPEMDKTQMLLFGNAPYVAPLFRPLALLPYPWAYSAWLVFSMSLYALGLRMLMSDLPLKQARTGFLLAFSCSLYIFETWIGGQLSVFAFFAIVLFLRGLERRRLFLAGVALGFAVYKPSLLAVPLAMLIVSGAWRILGGLLSSIAALGLFSVKMVGWTGIQGWINTLKLFETLSVGEHAVIRRVKYVDFNSFFHILLGNVSSVAHICSLLASGAAFLFLASAWWRSRSAPKDVQNLLWAATFAWTLVINVYVPVYDALVLVPVMVLVFQSLDSRTERSTFAAWLTLLYLASWLSQSFAQFLRVQILTIAIAGFGYWVLTLVRDRGPGMPGPYVARRRGDARVARTAVPVS